MKKNDMRMTCIRSLCVVLATAFCLGGPLRGGEPVHRYLRAFGHKIAPISLTILSTVLGLVPFLTDGPGEVFWFDLAVGTISGLLFSVLALLLFFPPFFLHKPPRRKSRG